MSIQDIPVLGGSGRIKTGAMRFEGDWPGLFIRGDDCMALFDLVNAAFSASDESPVGAIGMLQGILSKYFIIMKEDVFQFETEEAE
ncbi:MAG: hypothetical protein CEE38_23565 [Planctomycetes bacterium B3_Pla]|nr:MAG: hypothetical protein CEE38_23565 [Planctomycetes bacterium B3_Pla]